MFIIPAWTDGMKEWEDTKKNDVCTHAGEVEENFLFISWYILYTEEDGNVRENLANH